MRLAVPHRVVKRVNQQQERPASSDIYNREEIVFTMLLRTRLTDPRPQFLLYYDICLIMFPSEIKVSYLITSLPPPLQTTPFQGFISFKNTTWKYSMVISTRRQLPLSDNFVLVLIEFVSKNIIYRNISNSQRIIFCCLSTDLNNFDWTL